MNNLSELIAALTRLLGPQALVTQPDALATYDADASMIVACAPELVVLPANHEQAAAALALAVAAGMPVVARGAGTGIAGGAVPVRGGMLLSTARMDAVERIDLRSRLAVVGAGVINAELNGRLAPLGYQFAPDPSSQRASTLGGNLATNAGGPHCLKYGVTANHVLAVELARPDGQLLWTSTGVPDSAGYDLTGLLVGHEGTLGLITRAMVRLTPLPEANRVVMALFPSVIAASAAVSRIIAAGALPTSLEVMDYHGIRAVNDAYGLGLPEAAGVTLLIIEVDGVEEGLDDLLGAILALCRAEGAFELRPARTAAEQTRVWAARKSFAGAIGRLAPAYMLVDTVVPRTRLPTMMEYIEGLRQTYGMEVCNVFHAGDGNLHPLIPYDPRDADQVRRAHAVAKAVLTQSIAEGGVLSGEHGIGIEKQEYMPLLFSPAELQLQAAIYMVFNQGDHFNPDKRFPLATPPASLAAERHARLVARRHAAAARSDTKQTQLLTELQAIVGPEHCWLSTKAGQGLLCSTPATPEAFAQVVACCYAAGLMLRVTGGPLHAEASNGQGVLPSQALISTQRLTRVVTYEPDDLTISVEAGMSLGELQAHLGANSQMLPLDRAEATATIGSLVATAADGPRRLGYGNLRDWVLGLTLVEADGSLVRVGAQVVKNVTGYNLPRLLVGSRGSLGFIVGVSLRLFPRPPSSSTLAISFAEPAPAFALRDQLAASRLQPVAVEYVVGPQTNHSPTLYIRAEGHPAAVARHMSELQSYATSHRASATATFSGAQEEACWRELARISDGPLDAATCRLRLCSHPAELDAAIAAAVASAATHAIQLSIGARALSGVAYLLATGSPEAIAAMQADLAPNWPQLYPQDNGGGTPIWEQGQAPELARAIKEACDPCFALGIS
ncbi:FAD-binding oxidoreductase [Candidatus Viridilinea mediisalina]|uniref:Lactate dehydrogenase n=1 Tax=Candidatus Viridilinea mediisalina TaxID=2024553 RepID=A0A2A6REP7_9CHLR|nr:FAD-binding oxidoreductase [Candidatus Viridilinea mediisalina]PDW01537.1 lactate dehydrogenase [Candidatus Viridilinea mediisalina]